jgi:N-acetylneuraminic acid mutarotase
MRTSLKSSIAAVAVAAAVPAAAQNWVDITPPSGPEPSGRAYASAVFDTGDGKMVIFGGQTSSTRLNEVWEFDLDAHTWTDVTPAAGSAPAERRTPVSVYDPAGHRMITWSGQAIGNGFFNDVWEFDLTSNTWSEFAPTGGPPNIRYGAAGVFDPVAGDLVTFAGFTNQGRFDDVWRFGAAGTTWTDVSPVASPLERCLHSASYDSYGHRMIMYGGQNAGARDDIWAFDLDTNTWAELTPVVRPPGRWFAAHAYDAANNRVTIFGGNTGSEVKNEVWVFDLWTDSWTELLPSGTPPAAREGAACIYDGANDRLVVFGGMSGTYYNDVWSLENLSGTVTHVADAAPAAGTLLAQNSPNPFNPSTTIRYELEAPGRVVLRVYDARGRVVRTLVDATHESGPHAVVWDGRDDGGVRSASGVYFYRLDAGGAVLSKKMVLVE